MEKISWMDFVTNEEVFRRADEERNILLTKQTRKVSWVGHIWRRSCFSKHITEERVEVKGKRRKRRKQLLK
jgi:hypothetical protein